MNYRIVNLQRKGINMYYILKLISMFSEKLKAKLRSSELICCAECKRWDKFYCKFNSESWCKYNRI